jgi:UDP-N-acetylmuramoyl-L-alanyl-D-glutamate--2,6-diaminopimelate ligase
MILQHLVGAIPGTQIFGDRELEISGLEYDSRRVRAGQVFFAIPGMKQDGSQFIPEAVSRGAAAVVSEAPPSSFPGEPPRAWIQVLQARTAMALAANRFYNFPSREVKLVGVTGTNGKTTVSYLVASILRRAGWRPGLFGTIEYDIAFGLDAASGGAAGIPAPNTTPESVDLQRMLREVAGHGGRSAVMEVSSHALALDRVAGCEFHAAVFTNFSRDHLDFHQDLDNYFEAKKKLFFPAEGTPPPVFAVLNSDDERTAALRQRSPSRVLTYGVEAPADVTARRWKAGRDGLELTAETPAGSVEIRSPLLGRYNVSNVLASVATALTLEISPSEISQGILPVRVPGRMEAIDEGQPFLVLVDYAHTDDALRHLLAAARELAGEGRVILVFGCGGERDRSKRPLMGMAAAMSDRAVLTSDNPRSEEPLAILNDVIVGLQKARANYEVEPDRERAITLALRDARPHDTVLIAGKGHENYQWIGSRKLPFDDRAVTRAALREMGFEHAAHTR